MGAWSQEKKDARRRKARYAKNPIEAAFNAGWQGACEMHLYKSPVNYMKAFITFCAEHGIALDESWQRIAEQEAEPSKE